MHNVRKITDDLVYIGCSDRRLSLFESAYKVPDGMSYNSYLLKDEKTVLFDTVDKSCDIQFFENLKAALEGKPLDYLVVHHMEPDHASLIECVMEKYPETKIVCTAKAQQMIKQFFDLDLQGRSIIVKEGDTLNTGSHELQFILAPMVHWPEVMVTYDKKSKTLFSADAFGSFGAINGNLIDNELNLDEYRRYYTNIVGKYGMQVQMLLKKTAALDIQTICPLHGLMIKNHIDLILEKYGKWSAYEPEENGVLIAYSSVYGGTENTLEILAGKLADKGVKNIKMFNMSYADHSRVLAEAFKYSHIVLGSTTYNTGIFESVDTFINHLVSHNLQNRKYFLIENGSWAATCGSLMRAELEKLKGSEFLSDNFCIKSTLKEEQIAELDNVVNTIVKSLGL
ncbi:MAG: FprA family A-type flavoprotein [Candidatus Gastranaerophilales bacterium]|nr:FprA family A-type flavoprotein [Candidatus Gastranaerophilales bacterium]MCM1073914.1 FprA family A-type flavoprotein [Bacteroides sp.]